MLHDEVVNVAGKAARVIDWRGGLQIGNDEALYGSFAFVDKRDYPVERQEMLEVRLLGGCGIVSFAPKYWLVFLILSPFLLREFDNATNISDFGVTNCSVHLQILPVMNCHYQPAHASTWAGTNVVKLNPSTDSGLGVYLFSRPVNWKGRVAILDRNRRSRRDFQSIDVKSTGWSTTSPAKGFALATSSWLSPIRRPRLGQTLTCAIMRPNGTGTPKSEHLQTKCTLVEYLQDMIVGSPNRRGADSARTLCQSVDRIRRNDR